jgi:two-component system, NarL family, invasion response regulator UvrY
MIPSIARAREEVPGIDERDPRVPVSVVTADDDLRFRSALRSLVEATWPGAVAGEAASGEDAVTLVQQLRPDVVLIDLRMPGISGIAAACAIKRLRPATLVILVSSAHPDELPREIDECPADAIVAKCELRPPLLREAWARHAVGRGPGGTGSVK